MYVVKLEVFELETNESVNVETDDYFVDYDVLVSLDGKIALLNDGKIVGYADEEIYGVKYVHIFTSGENGFIKEEFIINEYY